MGLYKEMKETFEREYAQRDRLYKDRIIKWNSESPVLRIERPTNIPRARELGYKAKEGVVMVRVRIKGGKKKRQPPDGGRKPSKAGRFFSRQKSTQAIAEERAATKFTNCEVLNSYFVGSAGSSRFYEVILLDRSNPSVLADGNYSRVVSQGGRAFRGLTHAGRVHRGVASKGFGSVRFRPSRRQYMKRS